MTKGRVQDKEGRPIEVGDTVGTKFRGGKREGQVEAVLENERDVQDHASDGVSIKNPPKVVFTDQHGHRVSHNPGTLSHARSRHE
ncbi:hypothetical protein C8Q76DRAFT_818918 [Earliella scabrosa]|nr:hypothetical protein C8Q76DRAFT_818918 [Earliella scabrosa]